MDNNFQPPVDTPAEEAAEAAVQAVAQPAEEAVEAAAEAAEATVEEAAEAVEAAAAPVEEAAEAAAEAVEAPVERSAPAAAAPTAAPAAAPAAAPVGQLKTNRGLAKFIFLGILTLGIYDLVILCGVSQDINITASRYDGKKTMHFALIAFIFSWLTLGIAPIVWTHKICARMGAEKARRGLGDDFGAKDFWLWGVLGSLIIVGPFIFMHKFLKTDNMINADYNVKG